MTYQDDGYGYPEGRPGVPGVPEEYGEPAPRDPTPGRGRRRAAPPPDGAPGPAGPQQHHDPQWAQSGLGWEQGAWRQAQLEASAPTFLDYPAQPGRAPGPGYPDSYPPEPGDEYGRDLRGYPDPAYPEPGRRESDRREPDYRESAYPETEYQDPQHRDPGYPRPAYQDPRAAEPGYGRDAPGPRSPDGRIPAQPGPQADGYGAASGPAAASAAAPQSGRGAFGAAGLAVVFAIAAIAAVPVLAIAVALGQIGVAVGWLRTAGFPSARRTMALAAATGVAATVVTYRATLGDAPAEAAGALGVGFVVLIVDQLLVRRAGRDLGPAGRAGQGIAAAVSAAFLCVLPVGYLAAARTDAQVTAACALSAAAAVLCCALLGGTGRPLALAAGTVAAGAVGALTAMSLSAASGTSGGLLGGLAAGVFALIGVATADRLSREGAEVRISAQALPTAFAAIAALLVPALLRL